MEWLGINILGEVTTISDHDWRTEVRDQTRGESHDLILTNDKQRTTTTMMMIRWWWKLVNWKYYGVATLTGNQSRPKNPPTNSTSPAPGQLGPLNGSIVPFAYNELNSGKGFRWRQRGRLRMKSMMIGESTVFSWYGKSMEIRKSIWKVELSEPWLKPKTMTKLLINRGTNERHWMRLMGWPNLQIDQVHCRDYCCDVTYCL